MEGTAETEISEDGAAILEVTDATLDVFSKSTLLLLEKEDSVPDKDSKADNLKVTDKENLNKEDIENNNENIAHKDKINDCTNGKVVNCDNAKSCSENEKKHIENTINNDDCQNSTIVQDFDNTIVKQAITTSTPYKQENSKTKKNIKDLDDRHLWVYNINPSTSARKLKEDLSKFGNALVAKIVKNGGNYYGYALMENAACVQACIDNLHNKSIDGYRLELRNQPPNARNSEDNSDELKLSSEEKILEKKEKGSSKIERKVKECDKEGIRDLDKKNKNLSPQNEKSKSCKKVDKDRNKEKSLERKEKRSVTSLDDFRKSRKRSRSSDPLTLKVKERKNSPETSESRLRRMELEMERMRQRERDRERQFERRLEREERTLFLKRQIETDRLKLSEEKRKLDDEKLKLNDDKRKLENEKQKLSVDRRKFEDDLKKDRMEVERLQRKLREMEAKLEEERRKRKRTRSLSKTRKPGLLNSTKENRVSLAQPRAPEDRTDPWSSIDGKKYYKESELKRFEEDKKKFRSEIHVVSSTSSSSRNNPSFGGSASRRFESAVVFPPQQSRGYGEYGFHSRAEPSMNIPTVQSWNRSNYPPLHPSKAYQNETFRNPYNSSRKY